VIQIPVTLGHDWRGLDIQKQHTQFSQLTSRILPTLGYATGNGGDDQDFSLNLFYATVAAAAANLGLIVISHTLSHHSLSVSSFFTLLVGFIPSFIVLYFGVRAFSNLWVYLPNFFFCVMYSCTPFYRPLIYYLPQLTVPSYFPRIQS
jgi:hypothetical protein